MTPVADARSWAARYAEIADAMYALRRSCRRLTLLATSTVNPRHPLPASHLALVDAVAAAAASSTVPSRLEAIAQALRALLVTLHDTFWVAWLKIEFGRRLRRIAGRPAAVVMKSWGFGPESVDAKRDFYFGTTAPLLEERGVTCVRLCGNARGGSPR